MTDTEHSGHPEDQETIMNNDDERDYDEEQFNRHLLDDELDPEEEDGYKHYTAEDLESDSFGTDPDDEEYTEAELDAMAARNRELMSTPPTADLPGGRTVTRQGHRAAALQIISDWYDSEPAGNDPDNLHAALAHAVLALSAPAPDEGTWQQRAIEAEAALTTIGGIVASFTSWAGTDPNQDALSCLSEITRVLRVSGQQSDEIIARYRPEPPAGKVCATCNRPQGDPHEPWCPVVTGTLRSLNDRPA
jgi:hypothetical protein